MNLADMMASIAYMTLDEKEKFAGIGREINRLKDEGGQAEHIFTLYMTKHNIMTTALMRRDK